MIDQPVMDSLSRFKPRGWYFPGEVSIHIHDDDSITYEGVLHPFDDGEGAK